MSSAKEMSFKSLNFLRFLLLYFIIVNLTRTSSALFAQVHFDTSLASAQKALDIDDYQKADSIARDLYSIAKAQGEAQGEIASLAMLGDINLDQGQYRSAQSLYTRALQRLDSIPGKFPGLQSDLLHKLGNYLLTLNNYDQAILLLDSALLIRLQTYGSDGLKTADTYNNLGIAYQAMGDIDKALEYHFECQRIRESQLSPPHKLLAQSLNNIGLCLEIKDQFEDALDIYSRALDQYSSVMPPDQSAMADVLINAASAYMRMYQFERAITYTERALDIYNQVYKTDHPYKALAHNNIANAYLSNGEERKGLQHYEEALSMRIGIFGEIHPEVAQTYYNLAVYNMIVGKYEEARALFQTCERSLGKDMLEEPDLSRINNHLLYLEALRQQAELEVMIFRDQEGDIENLEAAARHYEELDKLLDYLRLRYESLGSKQDLAGAGHSIYSEAIETAFMLYQMTNEERFWHQAFFYSEKSKAVLLFDALQRSHAETFAGIPDSRLESIRNIELQISLAEKELYLRTLDQAEAIDSLKSYLLQANRELRDEIEELNQDFPKYFDLRYATAVPSIASIQQDLLDNDQSIVTYFNGPTYLSIFLINDDDFQVRQVGTSLEFDAYQDSLLQSINDFQLVSTRELSQNIGRYYRASHLMYRYLIEPIESHIKNDLIVVPDGALNFIPFEALISTYPSDVDDLKSLHYLVKDHPISYNYSIRALYALNQQTDKISLKSYLGFAPSFDPSINPDLPELAFNDQEVIEANEFMGGKRYVDDQATKERFLKLHDKYQVIHLATHGLANRNRDDFSFLAFTDNGDQPTHDETYLYTREIYNLRSNARVVILSACETATGKLYEGEGIASLARAFTYAGAESLIATRWNVNDRTTKDLVNGFLRGLKEGLPKHEALRQSILHFLDHSELRYAHPFYWSAFMTIGDVSPVEITASKSWVTLLLAGFLLMVGVTLILIRREIKRRKPSV